MIGVILSAGMGTRLRPLTDEIPKPLLEINNKTLLERMIKNCMTAGIREFILIVGYKKEKVFEIAPKLEEKLDISIKVIENKEYDVTNTSVSTYLASSYIEKENLDDFILINGDNVVDPEIITRISATDNTSLIVDDFKDLNEESFKLILEDVKTNEDNLIANGIISEIGKEIDIPSSTGEFIGVSKVIKNDITRFNEILTQLIKEDRKNYYDFAYKPLSRDTKIDYVLTNGLKWTEIDDHNDWKIANKLIEEFEN
ncbi:Choline kinase [Methanobrevibacter gottschalkii]|uniref:Choline kinase n=1 Tax=Methanobrevibacter gottschalkii TaxID=190974 RepID=A0A1H7NE93_9EURY|nr:phosphocholine cytidylyltransferase family protein [Methanobrevibacter gottschalkii]SEL21896.1 Choline kinase [Methanobrevibacter gottschalkii]